MLTAYLAQTQNSSPYPPTINMRYSSLLLIAIASAFGQYVAASSTDDENDTALMAMVDDLNDRYANGKPSGKQLYYE